MQATRLIPFPDEVAVNLGGANRETQERGAVQVERAQHDREIVRRHVEVEAATRTIRAPVTPAVVDAAAPATAT